MRVGFNAAFLWHPSRRGFNRYTWSLARALAARDDVDVFLLSDRPVHPSFIDDIRATVVVEPAPRHLWWEQHLLPRRIRDLHLDVFHAPASGGLPWIKPCAFVLTIHDVIGLAAPHLVLPPSLKARVHHGIRQWVALARADAILTVSRHSRCDIVRWLGVRADRVTVIPEGADGAFRPADPGAVAAVTARYGLAPRYVLYVGGFDCRKNIGTLVDAYARSRAAKELELVLVGEATPETEDLVRRARALGIERRVRFVGYVPEEDLPALYGGAAAFVYPSLYEGFGLQIAEAMACGVPVVASCRTSLPEVLDGAGLLVDPENPDEMAAAIDLAVFDAGSAADMRARGLAVAARLTWPRVADATLAVYERVARGRAPR